jgi:hypothetical protein
VCEELFIESVRGMCEVCLVGLDTASGIVYRICVRNPVPMCEGYARCVELVYTVSVEWFGMVWNGLVWFGLVWFGLENL